MARGALRSRVHACAASWHPSIERVLRITPGQSAVAPHPPGGGHRARRRRDRLSDRFLLCAWLAHRRQERARAGAPDPPGGSSSPFHTGVLEPLANRPLRTTGHVAIPGPEGVLARSVHVPLACDARDATPPAA